MPPYIVVDACVAGAWSFAEPYSHEAQKVLDAIENHHVITLAPDRFSVEVLRLCQKKTLPAPVGAAIAPDDAFERFLEVVTSPIVFWPSDELLEDAWLLAQATNLTTHDALYLALARNRGAELWTLDAKLAGVLASIVPNIHDLRTHVFPY
jgi:predicted nucleic acid-binding protein